MTQQATATHAPENGSSVHSALYDAGWARYGWPEAVGGLGGPAVLRAVLGEESAARDLVDSGLTVSADYINVSIKNEIVSLSPDYEAAKAALKP